MNLSPQKSLILFVLEPAFGLLVLLIGFPVQAQESDEGLDNAQSKQAISFYIDVRPILQAKCYACHQGAKQAGQYVMTDFEKLIAGGESNDRAIVAGKPLESYLFELIQIEDGFAEMPRDEKPLTLEEIELIKNWILQGATNDTPQHAAIKFTADNPPEYKLLPTVTSLDVAPDGNTIAVAGYHEVILHDVSAMFHKKSIETDSSSIPAEEFNSASSETNITARLVGLSERIESVRFSPDGKQLAVCGGSPGRMGEIQIWDVEKQKLLRSKQIGYDTIYGCSWSNDGKLLAFGCPDTTVRVIVAETGEEVLFNGAHNDWVLGTVFSTKNDHLITVSRDMSMKLIHVETQRFVDNITSITPGALKGGLNAVDCHPTQDMLLAAGADGSPRIYKMLRDKARKIGDDFNLIRAFPKLKGRVFGATFSLDGNKIAAVSSIDGSGQLKVFETESGKEKSKFDCSSGGLFAVAFMPDNAHVAIAGFDGIVRIINAQSGQLVGKFNSAPLEKK